MIDVELLAGWHETGPEKAGPVTFHWMARESRSLLQVAPPLAAGEPAFVAVCAVDPGGDLGGPLLTAWAGGRCLGEAPVGPQGWNQYAFPLPAGFALPEGDGSRLEVRLAVDRWVAPKPGVDPREFGLPVHDIRLLRIGSTRLPLVVELESTTACNIKPPCVMCYPRSNPAWPPAPPARDLDEGLLAAVRPLIGAATTLSLHGIGEPLLSRQLRRLLEQLEPGAIDLQFNTNGWLLDERWARLLVERRLNRLCFSLDAARPETYRRIRHGDLERVLENIRRLGRIKAELGSDRPLVELNMTLMEANLGEVEEFIALAAEVGARYVVFGLLNPTTDYEVAGEDFVFRYREQRLDEHSERFREAMARCRDLARRLGVDLSIHTNEVPL